jgi:hypothetical protein
MHRQLTELQTELDAASARARALVEPLDDATFNRRPQPGSWSVGECLEHLNITSLAFIPRIDSVLLAGDQSKVGDSAVFKAGFIGGLLAWSLEPPYRMKTKTPAQFIPPAVHEKDKVLAEFLRLQKALSERIDYCEGRNLNLLKIQSPFKENVSYNLYAAFRSILAHERRHLWQGERALEAFRA